MADITKSKPMEIAKAREVGGKLDTLAAVLADQTPGGLPVPRFAAVLERSAAVQALRLELAKSEALDAIMALQGSPLGFRTDLDSQGRSYPREVVADVTIWATALGASMTGNQVNIISGRGYLTKEYYQMATDTLQQSGVIESLTIDYSVPKSVGDGAITEVTVGLKLKGQKAIEHHMTVPVRVNKGQGVDAILGKVERRARRWAFERATGAVLPDGDVDDFRTGAIDVEAEAPTVAEPPRTDDRKVEKKVNYQAEPPEDFFAGDPNI